MLNHHFLSMLGVSVSVSIFIILFMIFSLTVKRKFTVKLNYYVWLIITIRLIYYEKIKLPVPLNLYQSEKFILTDQLTYSKTNPSNISQVNEAINNVVHSVSLFDYLSIAWFAITCSLILYQIISYVFLCRKMRKERENEVESNYYEILKHIQEEIRYIQPVKIILVNELVSPMMYGFFTPAIVLPNKEYTKQELEFIFKHELLHAKRHDIWYKVLLSIAKSIHWFNPIIRLACKQANNDLELACDYEVVFGKNTTYKKAYCLSIVSIIEKNINQSNSFTTNYSGGFYNMKKRVNHIMDYTVKRKGTILAVLIGIFFITSTTLLGCSFEKDNKEIASTQATPTTQTPSPTLKAANTDNTANTEQTANGNKDSNAVAKDESTVNEKEVKDGDAETTDSSLNEIINSPDSIAFQDMTREFAKAYFSRDTESLSTFLDDSVEATVYEKNIWDDLELFVLKWNPLDISKEGTVEVQYQFQQKGESSSSYLGIELAKVSGEWKVQGYYIEK